MCRLQMLDAGRSLVDPILFVVVLLASCVEPREHQVHHGMGGINGTMAFNGTGMMFPGPGGNVTTA